MQKKLDSIEEQLKGLETVQTRASEIVKSGRQVIRNNSIDDKDDAISSIKRVEEVLESAINEAFILAKDSDQPRTYDSLAKLIKEYGVLQTTKMNLHQKFPNNEETERNDGDEINDKNTIATSMQDVLDKVKKAEIDNE